MYLTYINIFNYVFCLLQSTDINYVQILQTALTGIKTRLKDRFYKISHFFIDALEIKVVDLLHVCVHGSGIFIQLLLHIHFVAVEVTINYHFHA